MIFLTIIGAVYSVIKIFLGSIIPIIFFGTFVVFNLVVFIVSIFKKDVLQGFFKIFGVKSAKVCSLIVLISAILFSAIASVSFAVNSHRDLANGNYSITANVKEVVETEDKTKLLLGNVYVNGKHYGFNIQANTTETNFEVGDKLSFDSYIFATKLVNNGTINTSILKTKLHYYCTIDAETLTKQSGKAGFFDAIKNKTKNILLDNMTDENAGFSYAVIFGDKSLLVNEYGSIFRNGGLAHILAVSGMHIAFLVGVVLLILKLCKVKIKAQFFVVLGVLLVYNILCGFAPSVFRASVMSLCLMLGMILGERNDNISNISLAGIIILAYQSLYLFDVGFLLSFGSVFGIFLLAKPIQRLLQKIKLPKFLASSISVIIAATLGTLPWVCKYFKIIAPISIVSNLVVLPLFSVMYIVLLFGVAINLIFTVPALIIFAEFFVNIVVSWSAVLAKFGVIATINFDNICAIIYYFVLLLISPYFMMKNKTKTVCVLSCCLLLTSVLANCNSAKIFNKNMIFANENASKTLFFTTKSGKTILSNASNTEYFTYNVDNFMSEKGVVQIDYFFVYNYQDDMQTNVSYVVNKYKVKNLYLFGEYQNSTLLGLMKSIYSTNIFNNIENLNNTITICNDVKIGCYQNGNATKAVCIDISNYKTLQILSSISQTEILADGFFAQDYDLLYVERYNARYADINCEMYVCVSAVQTGENVHILQDDESLLMSFEIKSLCVNH